MATTTAPLAQRLQNPSAGKTAFPEFGIPDLVDSSTSSSDSEDDSVQRARYSTKEDQDVAVFMAIAEKLSVSSLLHLLQGHVQSLQLQGLQSDTRQALRDAKVAEARRPKMPLKQRKAFRFAVISGGEIRKVVHEMESFKHVKELWWNDDEMMAMRSQAIQTVKYFKKHRPKYIQTVETVATGTDQFEVEQAVKQLSKDSYARGLETHICSFLSHARSETVQAVLDEQKESRMCADSYELTAESLCGQSQAYSKMSRQFAAKMGEADHIEALKAAISAWLPEV